MGTDSWKVRKRKCALTSTGLLMEGLGSIADRSIAKSEALNIGKWTNLLLLT